MPDQSLEIQKQRFAHVREWVFDLDNTLYHPDCALFDQIGDLMTDYVAQLLNLHPHEAQSLRDLYWHEHGTTLNGLMLHHEVDPAHFLDKVHDIDLAHIEDRPELKSAISSLPGRKIIFTNASTKHAERVTEALGISDAFDEMYSIEHTELVPKPASAAFDAIFSRTGLHPAKAAMFEDDPRNLVYPHQVGMRTVLVGLAPAQTGHIDYHTTDLSGFLTQLV